MRKTKKMIRLLLMMLMLGCICTASVSVSAAVKNGIKTENGKQYYYKNGVKIKNKLGYKIGTSYYKINLNGVITKITKAEGLAGIYAEAHDRNLKNCFMDIAKMKYVAAGKKTNANYACYGFEKNQGDCNVQACCFYYVAKALGKKNVSVVKGYIPKASGGFGSHTWVTIKTATSLNVYDPSLAQYYSVKGMAAKMKLAFNFHYGDKGTYQYHNLKKKSLA